MPCPPIHTVFEQIAWSYANLARAHAALSAGRIRYVQTDHIIRSRLFGGLKSGKMTIRSLYHDERIKILSTPRCSYCGAVERLTIDHLIPRIRGGSDDGANLVLACNCCNSAKRDSDLLDWHNRIGCFPPLMVLRRYLKLVFEHCEMREALELPLDSGELAHFPFRIGLLPLRFPPLGEMRL